MLKRTRDIKLAESLSPITKKLDVINESTKNLGEIVKKADVEDGDTQTPAIENITSTQSLRDRLVLKKKFNNQIFRYIFVLVDKFSKYLLAVPLKNKNSQTITQGLSNILTTSKRSPTKLESDRGAEVF